MHGGDGERGADESVRSREAPHDTQLAAPPSRRIAQIDGRGLQQRHEKRHKIKTATTSSPFPKNSTSIW